MKNKTDRGIILLSALAALVVMSFLVGVTHWLAISAVRLERFYRSGNEATQDELSGVARQYLGERPEITTKFRCLDGTSRSLCSLQGPLFDFSHALATTTTCQNLVPLTFPRTGLFSSSVQSNSSCLLTGNLKEDVALMTNIEATQIAVDAHGASSLALSGFFLAAEVQASAPLTIMAGGDIRINQLRSSNDITLVSGTGIILIKQISGSPRVSAFAAQGVFMPTRNGGILSESVPTRSFELIGFLPIPK